MKGGLRRKLISYFLSFVLVICLVFLFFDWLKIDSLVKSHLKEFGGEVVKDLSHCSQQALVTDNRLFLESVFQELSQMEEVVLTAVYDKQGNIFLSQNELAIEPKIAPAIVNQIGDSPEVVFMQRELASGQKVYDFYAPVRLSQNGYLEGDEIKGYARVVLTLGKAVESARAALLQSLFIVFVLLFLSLFAAFLLADRLVRPIKLFTQRVKKIGEGNLDHHFQIKTGDEIEELAKAFNVMVKRLQNSRKQLEEAKDVLEIRVKARTEELEEFAEGLNNQVKERTSELRERLDELERFHKLVVGREMKMLELKKEIKELKEKLKKK